MKASFKPRARLLKLLGDQLIGTPQLAIFELVKNAYDADADKVEVVIKNPTSLQNAKIEITDFGGIGMDMDTIVNIWLEPGADHKEIQKEKGIRTKKHDRLPLGEKGVGRFAVHKLGRKIMLITKAENSPELTLEIDWDILDNVKYIEDANIDILTNEQPTYFKNGLTGTKIIISKLNNELSRTDVRNLHRNIESIKSPFEQQKFKLDNKISEFNVSLRVEDHPDWTEDLYDIQSIVDLALFKFTFLFENGKWSWYYEFSPNEHLKKEFKIEPYQSSGENEFCEFFDADSRKLYKKDPNGFFSDLGTICGEIYAFDFDSEVKKFYSETGAIKLFLSENKGIRIYRDGMRVYNYGEPHDDWLQMDNRRVNRLSTGLNRSITVGAISINLSETKNLIEKTNREGFIENETYDKLRQTVRSALGKFESFRLIDKDRLRKLTKSDAKSSIADIENPIDELKKIVGSKGWDKELTPTINRIEKSYKEMRDIMLTAGMAGLNMSVAFHEIYRGIKDTKKALEAEVDKKIILKQFDRFELLLDTYSRMLKKETIKEYSLKELLKGNMELAQVRFEMHDIIVSCPILVDEQPDYLVKIPPHLLTSAINNLIDNSIYWLDQRWGSENKKYLYIGISEEFDKGPAIVIADNGPGWRNINAEEAIKPFLTTKPGGMGIGLYYTDTVMEMLGGELVILKNDDIEVPEKADGAVIALVFNGGTPCKK